MPVMKKKRVERPRKNPAKREAGPADIMEEFRIFAEKIKGETDDDTIQIFKERLEALVDEHEGVTGTLIGQVAEAERKVTEEALKGREALEAEKKTAAENPKALEAANARLLQCEATIRAMERQDAPGESVRWPSARVRSVVETIRSFIDIGVVNGCSVVHIRMKTPFGSDFRRAAAGDRIFTGGFEALHTRMVAIETVHRATRERLIRRFDSFQGERFLIEPHEYEMVAEISGLLILMLTSRVNMTRLDSWIHVSSNLMNIGTDFFARAYSDTALNERLHCVEDGVSQAMKRKGQNTLLEIVNVADLAGVERTAPSAMDTIQSFVSDQVGLLATEARSRVPSIAPSQSASNVRAPFRPETRGTCAACGKQGHGFSKCPRSHPTWRAAKAKGADDFEISARMISEFAKTLPIPR